MKVKSTRRNACPAFSWKRNFFWQAQGRTREGLHCQADVSSYQRSLRAARNVQVVEANSHGFCQSHIRQLNKQVCSFAGVKQGRRCSVPFEPWRDLWLQALCHFPVDILSFLWPVSGTAGSEWLRLCGHSWTQHLFQQSVGLCFFFKFHWDERNRKGWNFCRFRQIRDMVAWIVSEPMMIYYLEQFRDAYWPDGKLTEQWPERTDEQKLETRLKSKEKFLKFTTGISFVTFSGWRSTFLSSVVALVVVVVTAVFSFPQHSLCQRASSLTSAFVVSLGCGSHQTKQDFWQSKPHIGPWRLEFRMKRVGTLSIGHITDSQMFAAILINPKLLVLPIYRRTERSGWRTQRAQRFRQVLRGNAGRQAEQTSLLRKWHECKSWNE